MTSHFLLVQFGDLTSLRSLKTLHSHNHAHGRNMECKWPLTAAGNDDMNSRYWLQCLRPSTKCPQTAMEVM